MNILISRNIGSGILGVELLFGNLLNGVNMEDFSGIVLRHDAAPFRYKSSDGLVLGFTKFGICFVVVACTEGDGCGNGGKE